MAINDSDVEGQSESTVLLRPNRRTGVDNESTCCTRFNVGAVGVLGISLTVAIYLITTYVFDFNKCSIAQEMSLYLYLIFFLINTIIILAAAMMDEESEVGNSEGCNLETIYYTGVIVICEISIFVLYFQLCAHVFEVDPIFFIADSCSHVQTSYSILNWSLYVLNWIFVAVIVCISCVWWVIKCMNGGGFEPGDFQSLND